MVMGVGPLSSLSARNFSWSSLGTSNTAPLESAWSVSLRSWMSFSSMRCLRKFHT